MSGTNFVMQRFSKESDQEITSFEDIIVFFVFFGAFVINFLNLYSNSTLIQYNLNLSFLMLFSCFFSIVVMVPISILFTVGSNCLIYIKGADRQNSLFSAIVFDIISILAFFLRFFLQVIRWCLFLGTYYLLHEFVFEFAYHTLISVFEASNNQTSVLYYISTNVIVTGVVSLLRFVFEFLDMCVILVIQLTAFLAVILWLFNYLFSVSLDDLYENLFESKLDIKC